MRDTLAAAMADAGWRPEKEKTGLLPAERTPREPPDRWEPQREEDEDENDEEEIEEEETADVGRQRGGTEGGPSLRRPADIWIPAGVLGGKTGLQSTACDLAITSCLTADVPIKRSQVNGAKKQFKWYAEKRKAEDTEARLRQRGIELRP